MFRHRNPPIPENVRLIIGGETVPLELEYRGKHKGMHHWRAVLPLALHEHWPGAEIVADLIPARTAIEIGFYQARVTEG